MRRAGGTTPVAHSSLLVGDAAVLFSPACVLLQKAAQCRGSAGGREADDGWTRWWAAGLRRLSALRWNAAGLTLAKRLALSAKLRGEDVLFCVMGGTLTSPTPKPPPLAWRGAAARDCSQLSWRRCVPQVSTHGSPNLFDKTRGIIILNTGWAPRYEARGP
ncbi:hypothetical protein TcG_04486 [Trypanosoma cruzi]|nr:hypothetical protein TcG_04486 [Trypanosoma cruzi]